MKKHGLGVAACLLALLLAACGSQQNDVSSEPSPVFSEAAVSESEAEPGESQSASSSEAADEAGGNILVACFSHTGTTKGVAAEIQAQTGADFFEILPETPYADDYSSMLDIAREEQETNARPVFTGAVEGFEDYDTIFLGYPIWHGSCPMIIHSFLEAYDFSGKTIIPFCTSGSSGIARSVADIQAACGDAVLLEGLGVSGAAAAAPQESVTTWLEGLGLAAQATDSGSAAGSTEEPEGNTLYIHANDHVFTAALVDNSSTRELKELLADGPLTIDMHDYGSMEKVGEIGASLPTNDEPITTVAGDLILYQGSRFVIYYAPNDWSFTRLGKIQEVTGEELKAALGDGDVTVTLSLEP